VLSSDCPVALRAQLTRMWSLIAQPREPGSGRLWRARLVAVDATLPTCELYDGADVLFGRSDRCIVRVADVTVSHEHCRVFVKDNGEVWLEDLSTHGTFVNRLKVGHRLRVKLEHGDTVWLSKAALKSKTQTCHFVVHFADQIESRIVEFPSKFKCNSSETPKFVKKTSKKTGQAYLLNVRTGETCLDSNENK